MKTQHTQTCETLRGEFTALSVYYIKNKTKHKTLDPSHVSDSAAQQKVLDQQVEIILQRVDDNK